MTSDILRASEVAYNAYSAFEPNSIPISGFSIIGATSFAGGFEAIAYRSTVDNTVYIGFGGSGDGNRSYHWPIRRP